MNVSYAKSSKGPDASAAPAPPKPRLRGWLHLGMAPVVQLAGLILMVLTPSLLGRTGVAIYLASASVLFGTSAAYHRGNWSARVSGVLRRLDHANIFLFIAGTYTPLALLLLDGTSRTILLTLIWAIAAAGITFKVIWMNAPRWLYTALYLLMGWAALGWLGQFWASGGPAVVLLIALGGLLYTVGAVVYALKRPDPSPTWFGYHEIFHACTILAAMAHFAAIALTVLA